MYTQMCTIFSMHKLLCMIVLAQTAMYDCINTYLLFFFGKLFLSLGLFLKVLMHLCEVTLIKISNMSSLFRSHFLIYTHFSNNVCIVCTCVGVCAHI